MQICGMQKTTLIDFPGIVATTVFTAGCNFRCPFCQNVTLVIPDLKPPVILDEVNDFLGKRLGLIKGVCISGGEPCLQPDLPEYITELRELGYLVKLDTNGSNPAMLRELHERKLLDYVAMDIKTSPENYAEFVTCPDFSLEDIQESIDFLMQSDLKYEFRTTVVKEFHTKEILLDIATWIKGCSAYTLQVFDDSTPNLFLGLHTPTNEELYEFTDCVREIIPHVTLEGLDML